MIKTIIYGGSFDPVHKGHEDIINKLSDRFDEVIVVPTSISPFKQLNKAAPAQLRLQMLRSIKFSDNVMISDYEIAKKELSYSINTVKHFSRPDRELYFAIGSEGARTLDKWKSAEELKKLCHFYVIKRPGYDKSELNNVTYADFCGQDISSSEVKVAVALNKETSLLSESVSKMIRQNGLYDDYKKYTDAYSVFGLKPERIEHTYRATIEGIKLAKRYDADVNDCCIALLLHDIGKYVTPERLESLNIKAPDCSELPLSCRHAEYGAAICEQYFGLKPSIVEAVRTHTTCGMNMDTLSEIVSLADYIEPMRKFKGIEEIRKAACVSLSLAIEMMLKNVIEYLRGQGREIVPVTKEVYKKYKRINEGKQYGTI